MNYCCSRITALVSEVVFVVAEMGTEKENDTYSGKHKCYFPLFVAWGTGPLYFRNKTEFR